MSRVESEWVESDKTLVNFVVRLAESCEIGKSLKEWKIIVGLANHYEIGNLLWKLRVAQDSHHLVVVVGSLWWSSP